MVEQYEDIHLLEKYDYVLGVDEVGRGCIAGPVTVGCVMITKESSLIKGVKDSKKLSKKLRGEIYSKSRENSENIFFISDVTNEVIDEIGISNSIRRAITESVERVLSIISNSSLKGILFIDGYFKDNFQLDIESKMIIKGDDKCYSIGLASILAKVHRDEIMGNVSSDYPEFDFASNVGYGTKKHLLALRKFGYCNQHRKSFEPLKSSILNNSISPIEYYGSVAQR